MIKSPYRRGSEDGFFFGFYLMAMFFSSIFASHLPLLTMVSMAMIVAVPLVVYRMMRSYERSLGALASFPMLWMYGVVVFFCGMLIAGSALEIYMKWIEPDFIIGQLRGVAALEGTAPGTFIDTAADLAAKMIEANFVPAPMDIVAELLMLAIVTGSVLSIVLSACLALRRRSVSARAPRPQQ